MDSSSLSINYFGSNSPSGWDACFNTAFTFTLICVGWVFFRCETFADAFRYLSRMFNLVHYWSAEQYVVRAVVMHNVALTAFIAATVICFAPSLPQILQTIERMRNSASELQITLYRFTTSVACLFLSVLAQTTAHYAPFIYFRF